jgi:two-component system, NtrC family, response regulator AtoC
MARVLIADDEVGIRSFIADTLEMVGHEVAEARNGLEAIVELLKSPYDVLITDLKMPGADGLAVLRAARELRPGLAVILLTAHGSFELAVQDMEEGAFDYLQKPLGSPAELRRLVERAAQRSVGTAAG